MTREDEEDPLPEWALDMEWANPREEAEDDGVLPIYIQPLLTKENPVFKAVDGKKTDKVQRVFNEIFEEIKQGDPDAVLDRQPFERLECFKAGVKRAATELEAKEKAWEERGDNYCSWGRAAGSIGGLFIGLQCKMEATRGLAYEIVERFYRSSYGENVFHREVVRQINHIADELTRIPPGAIGLVVGALIGTYLVAIPYFMTRDKERENRIKYLHELCSKAEKAIGDRL